jgi:coenzyme F420-reducing hydrogenase alpha subunit
MSKRTLSIHVEHLTRVEGHGDIVVDLREGQLEKCELQIVEAPRFFEAMLRGRSVFEAQHITSRICGICACGHTLASLHAAEAALRIQPSPQTELLREFLLHMEILDSHVLHIYLLVAPDLFGVPSFLPLISSHQEVVRRALRMKKSVNDVCDIGFGRHIHPITTTIGGFTKLPSASELDAMLDHLRNLRVDMRATVELAKTLTFPDFSRPTTYAGLLSDTAAYPLLRGDIGTSSGHRWPVSEYRQLTNEFVVPHSSAKHTHVDQDSYAVGALARFNLNHAKLRPEAQNAAAELGLIAPCSNPYLNTVAQVVECVHSLEAGIALLEQAQQQGLDYSQARTIGVNELRNTPVCAGRGAGAVEVPRGILFHEYTVDEAGIICDANCVIPTGQNCHNIEDDMRKLIPEIMDRSQAEITLALEMLVRAYDPCISCSAHFLKVRYVK